MRECSRNCIVFLLLGELRLKDSFCQCELKTITDIDQCNY